MLSRPNVLPSFEADQPLPPTWSGVEPSSSKTQINELRELPHSRHDLTNGTASSSNDLIHSQTQPVFANGSNWDNHDLIACDDPLLFTSPNTEFDMSTLTEIEGLFTSTHTSLFPLSQQHFALPLNSDYDLMNTFSPLASDTMDISKIRAKIMALGLPDNDLKYLQNEGCFSLPAMPLFRELMERYFRFVHPNLPIVSEDKFWALWNGGVFEIRDLSFLMVQAMLFASVGV